MDPISATSQAVSAQGAGGSAATEDLAMLKMAQDAAKTQAAQLLEALPPPRSASPPGVGGKIDLTA